MRMKIPEIKTAAELEAFFAKDNIFVSCLTTTANLTSGKTAHLLGREAAKQALSLAGFKKDFEILKGHKGEPLFPSGFYGSISHCKDYSQNQDIVSYSAIALVSKNKKLGVDMESIVRNFSGEIISRVATTSESDFIVAHKDPLLLLAFFSSKESIYKLLAPDFKGTLGFQDAELQYDQTDNAFKGAVKKCNVDFLTIKVLQYQNKLITYILQ